MDSFAFVLNVTSLDADSFTLAPGHILRRAQPEEIALIKANVTKFAGGSHSFFGFVLWEGKLPFSAGTRIEELPESEWRYFVISFTGSNVTLVDIQRALDLAPTELEIAFAVLFTPAVMGGIVIQPDRLFRVLEDTRGAFHGVDVEPPLVSVSQAAVEEIQTIFSQLRSSDPLLIDVKALAGRIGALKSLSYQSPLTFLGYFAILESLLSHAPKASDPYDSITRQVKTKIALLNNRFASRIDYSPFQAAPAETVWTKMYTYRSAVAHGSTPSFTGDLASLRNHEQALGLLKRTVKAVVRQALIEPQLLLDLREC